MESLYIHATPRWKQEISTREPQHDNRPVFYYDGNFRTWDQVERRALLNRTFAALATK